MTAAIHRQHRAFVGNLKALEMEITDPGGLATSLYEKGLIDKLTWQRATGTLPAAPVERARELLQKLEGKMEKKETAFDTLLHILDSDPTKEDICKMLRADRDEVPENAMDPDTSRRHGISYNRSFVLIGSSLVTLLIALLWYNFDICYLGTCYSKSLPYVDHFVGREEDIRNITGYLDFTGSNVQVVHIVGPPGFGKSTLAKQIGHILVKRRINVHYVDVRGITDIDTLAEKVMLSIVDALSYKVTFTHLEKWVRNQYSNALIILDNCDGLLESHRDDFLDAIKSLLAFSRRNVKYILTSQKWVADIGNFQLHDIYNLSSEASMQLLDRVAPSLMDDQKVEIAKLTGNVPLALEVIGAIFKFPDAPTAEEVIHGLRENPVDTLSPSKLHSTIDVSIGLAYKYLMPEMKQLCVNLSHFPGTFNKLSAHAIFDKNPIVIIGIDELVRRSLLQFNHATKRYHFHQLIQAYFLHVSSQKKKESTLQQFQSAFQQYFALLLNKTLISDFDKALNTLDEERHNFQYMFTLFTTSKHVNNTFFGVQVTLHALQLNVLQLRFLPKEIINISLNMLKALESYTPDEEASILETYCEVVILVAKQQRLLHIKADIAIETLSSRKIRIDRGYRKDILSMNAYITFYSLLAQYYKENGEQKKAFRCHVRILSKSHGQLGHCYPRCDYFSISEAYEDTGNKERAFEFRECAFEHQHRSLNPMRLVKLYIYLYYDYSNATLGNNVSKASILSKAIRGTMYLYLLRANRSEYVEEVYYDAVEFFMANNLEKQAINLQRKMISVVGVEQCLAEGAFECATHYLISAYGAWNRQCYHICVHLGSLSFYLFSKVNSKYAVHSAVLISRTYYMVGNYSDSQIWSKRILQLVNEYLKDEYSLKLRRDRQTACECILMTGDVSNVWCYGYLIKDTMSITAANIIEEMYTEYNFNQPDRVVLSNVTGLTEQRYSYVWTQFNTLVDKLQCTIKKHLSNAEWGVTLLLQSIRDYSFPIKVVIMIVHFTGYIVLPYILSLSAIIIFPRCFSASCCLPCLNLCIFLSFSLTMIVFLFVLGLDWLY